MRRPCQGREPILTGREATLTGREATHTAVWRAPTFVIFCSDPFDSRQPDTAYTDEVAAVHALSGTYTLIDYEALVDGHDPARAVRRVAARSTMTLALYRGWMLRAVHYERLYAALSARQVQLINDPAAYRHAHHFPESFDIIAPHTPASVWLPTDGDVSMDRVMEALRPFGTRPVVVKDFVKSQKHYWAEACFIPSASDRQAVERVVRRFLTLQGPDLEGGLVFREFLDLAPVATHSRSGMPLTKEYRLFFLDGELIYAVRYWDEGDYAGAAPPGDLFTDVARAVRTRFFTMDVAQRRDGAWTIIELGDGQVAGLPEAANVPALYAALNDHWPAPQP